MNTAAAVDQTPTSTENDALLTREIQRWAFQTDPACIARRHLGLAGIWLTLGLLMSLLLRLELLTPAMDFVQARTFGTLLSLHGFLLIYFVALPVFPGVVGHLALSRWAKPGQALVFPRLARISWHLLAAGGALVASSFLFGGTQIGWSFDAEFGGRFTQPGVAPMAVGVLLSATALALTGINTLASLRALRRSGMPSGGQRILAEALGCGSLISVVIAPLLAVAMLLVLADVWFGFSVFDPKMGGDPQLFVRLFRFFFVPAQGMLLLFGLGVALSVVADRCRRAVFSRWHLYIFALMVALAFGSWGAEIGWGGQSPSVSVLAANPLNMLVLAGFLVALLFVIRFLRSGLVTVDTALIYALGFFVTAAQGLGASLLTALPQGGAGLANTQLATGQLHLMMMAILGMALPAGLHAVWPTLTGRNFSEGFGRPVALLVVAGTQLSFLPMLALGLKGVSYRANAYPPEFQLWQVLATAGASVLLVSLALAALNLAGARRISAVRSAVVALGVCFLLSGAMGCGPRAAAQPETVQLKISGMHCESCAQSITKKLQQTGALLVADVHFSNDVQTVQYDAARADVPHLIGVITNLGFGAEVAVAQE